MMPTHESEIVDAILLENTRLSAELIAERRDRRKAEMALRASEASVREMQRISRTGSWRWNVRTGAVQWSGEHFRIFGFDPAIEQPSYAKYMQRIHPEDHFSVERTLAEASLKKSMFSHEYRIVLPDGSIKHVQSTGHPDENTSSDLEFVGTVLDITERRHAEEAARRAQAAPTRPEAPVIRILIRDRLIWCAPAGSGGSGGLRSSPARRKSGQRPARR